MGLVGLMRPMLRDRLEPETANRKRPTANRQLQTRNRFLTCWAVDR